MTKCKNTHTNTFCYFFFLHFGGRRQADIFRTCRPKGKFRRRSSNENIEDVNESIPKSRNTKTEVERSESDLHFLAEMFIPTPTRLIWDAFSHADFFARRPFTRPSIAVCSQVLIHTAEWTGRRGESETSKQQQRGISRLNWEFGIPPPSYLAPQEENKNHVTPMAMRPD